MAPRPAATPLLHYCRTPPSATPHHLKLSPPPPPPSPPLPSTAAAITSAALAQADENWKSKDPKALAHEIATFMGGEWPTRPVRKVQLASDGVPTVPR